MDYFGSGPVTELTVSDVFESEVQNEMDNILSQNSSRFSPQPTAVQSTELLNNSALDSADFNLGTISNYFPEQAVHTSSQDMSSISLVTTSASSADMNQISAMDGVENGINGLLVDPQTGLPVSTSGLQLDPNSAQASLQMIVNNLPEIQAQLAASSVESLGLTSLGNIGQTPIVSLAQQLQTEPLNLSDLQGNQNLTIQNGTLQSSDIQHINLANFNDLTTQTLISQLQQQQQLHVVNGNIQTGTILKNGHINSPVKSTKKHGGSTTISNSTSKMKTEKVYPKPGYSYSCLITMALKNSQTGCLPVSEIYQFMCENFPYFKTAPDGWKNSVRHNLSLNKCFAKIEKAAPPTANGSARKGCLWAMNPEKQTKMEEEVYKSTKKDPMGIKRAMAKPEEFPRIEALSRVCHKSPKSSPKSPSPPVTKVPPPLESIISTGTTTTKVTKSESRSDLNQGVFTGEQFFTATLNMQDPTLMQLDGDLGLQSNFWDTFSDMDAPITTSSLTSLSFNGSFLDSSPVKDSTHTVSSGFLSLDSPQMHATTLQFVSPSRTPKVSVLM